MTGQYQPGQGFVSSPRMALAQALMAQGASREPVRSPVEGIARLLTAGIGGWVGSGVKKDQQDALADALKALEDPSVAPEGRPKAAYSAYAAKSPDTPNPFEGIMLQRMMPKSSDSPLGKLIDDMNRLPPNHPQRKAFEAQIAKETENLPQNMRFNSDTGLVENRPGFIDATAALKKAEAGGTAQGTADVNLVMGPKQIAAETAPKAAQAGQVAQATTSGNIRGDLAPITVNGQTMPGAAAVARQREVGQRQGTNAVPTAPPGYEMVEDQMRPITGGPADIATIEATEAARAKGSGTTNTNYNAQADRLRNDFNGNQTVKSYREVVPIFASMQEAAKTDTKAADLNLVYGLAKIFDPNSVVREGEMVMVKDTAALPDWLVGSINGLNGGARLQPETRKAVMDQAASRFNAYDSAYSQVVDQVKGMAERSGVKPEDVIVHLKVPQAREEAPTAPRVTDDAAGRAVFAKIPPGSPYYGPDGKLYIKPAGGQ